MWSCRRQEERASIAAERDARSSATEQRRAGALPEMDRWVSYDAAYSTSLKRSVSMMRFFLTTRDKDIAVKRWTAAQSILIMSMIARWAQSEKSKQPMRVKAVSYVCVE